MIPVADAHHHDWRQADLPWLVGPMQPRIFGPYEPIRRDYLMEEYRSDIAGAAVVSSVYVQANWAAVRFEGEVAWVQSVATGRDGRTRSWATRTSPQRTCATSWIVSGRTSECRGVRQQFHWHEVELYRFAARRRLAAEPDVRKNVARLGEYGWILDLQVFTSQMADAAGLAAACPEVTFVLQHAGMLEDLSPDGWKAWREGMRGLSRQPNVNVKLSGLGTFLRRNDGSHIRAVVTDTVEMFGVERCLFGSNFPIEKLWTDYGALAEAYHAATSGFRELERRQIFHDTAARIYLLPPGDGPVSVN